MIFVMALDGLAIHTSLNKGEPADAVNRSEVV